MRQGVGVEVGDGLGAGVGVGAGRCPDGEAPPATWGALDDASAWAGPRNARKANAPTAMNALRSGTMTTSVGFAAVLDRVTAMIVVTDDGGVTSPVDEPVVPHRDHVRGFVLDLESGRLRELAVQRRGHGLAGMPLEVD